MGRLKDIAVSRMFFLAVTLLWPMSLVHVVSSNVCQLSILRIFTYECKMGYVKPVATC